MRNFGSIDGSFREVMVLADRMTYVLTLIAV